MAKPARKIVFSRSRDIPFNKLVLSASNVRRVRADINVEELAEDIARREDLVQGLNVRPVLDADGNETGMFEVPAGGRRFRAIERLVKAKRFPKDVRADRLQRRRCPRQGAGTLSGRAHRRTGGRVMSRDAAELARRLAREAEAVCRHYLSNGKREGRYWLVGDVQNTPGRSLFVRLYESPKGPPGKWTDAATGEHGDLLDIIRERLGLRDFRDVAHEARRFLNLPRPDPGLVPGPVRPAVQRGSRDAARRLFAISRPTEGTLVELYLRRRGIADLHHGGSLRYQPRCYYHGAYDELPPEIWPAMIACVTDIDGVITGVHRTWLDPEGFDSNRLGKAPIDTPRRAMGDLLGNAVRFGVANDVLVAGEGVETMLSLRSVLPTLPMAAALSANHLAALLVPLTLRRLYIACDADAAGMGAATTLTSCMKEAGIAAFPLSPKHDDFNQDLRTLGPEGLRAAMRGQLLPEDVLRFLPQGGTDTG